MKDSGVKIKIVLTQNEADLFEWGDDCDMVYGYLLKSLDLEEREDEFDNVCVLGFDTTDEDFDKNVLHGATLAADIVANLLAAMESEGNSEIFVGLYKDYLAGCVVSIASFIEANAD